MEAVIELLHYETKSFLGTRHIFGFPYFCQTTAVVWFYFLFPSREMLKIKPLPSANSILRENMLRKKKKTQTKPKFLLKFIQCISWHYYCLWGLHLQHHLYSRITSFDAFQVPCFSVFLPLASFLLTLSHHIGPDYTKSNEIHFSAWSSLLNF